MTPRRARQLRADEPLLTLAQAAEACGVSRDTIKRRNAAGQFPGAHKSPTGAWVIPLDDLEAAGLHPGAQGDAPAATTAGGALIPLSELSGLFDRLAEAERRAAKAEAEAEHLRDRLAELRASGTAQGAPGGPGGNAPGVRRSWWRPRGRG